MRRVIDEIALAPTAGKAFEQAKALVDQAARVLADDRARRAPRPPTWNDPDRDHFMSTSPFTGPASPLSPPIRLSVGDDGTSNATVYGDVTFGAAYEGPPGCVHGGFIAAGFDEVLGYVVSRTQHPGMTAKLSVTYRSPSPLGQPLRFSARIDHVDGRKTTVAGELRTVADGRLCAQGTALFIGVRPEHFAVVAPDVVSEMRRKLSAPAEAGTQTSA